MLVPCEDADNDPRPCLALMLPLTGAEDILSSVN